MNVPNGMKIKAAGQVEQESWDLVPVLSNSTVQCGTGTVPVLPVGGSSYVYVADCFFGNFQLRPHHKRIHK